jgi:hypothetical protein
VVSGVDSQFLLLISQRSHWPKSWATRSLWAGMSTMVTIEHLCCQNSQCPNAGIRGGENLYFRGFSGKSRRIRLVYCRTCKHAFSERKGTVLEQARLPDDKAFAILKHIQEGCGTRATSRLVGVDKNTVTRYLAMAGTHAEKIHDELVAFSPSDS